jgi:[NiFe] hydrogenase assembly HybE family chaperone
MSLKPEQPLSMEQSDAMLPKNLIIHEISQKLESAFTVIYRDRMLDVPILNNEIKVRAVDFQPWNTSYLGIMMTPWFMNLMLLPGETENWGDLQELSSLTHTFPSGRYEFLVGFEAEIGKYQSCSLFSPMFDFADNEAAIETAEAAMKELMNTDNLDQGDINNQQIENIWNGLEERPKNAQDVGEISSSNTSPSGKSFTEKIDQPISRRELLRGAPFLDEY